MTLLMQIFDWLPFSWVHYEFMKYALTAILIITPVFGLVSTAVINNRMAFFSDIIGHSALTGIAIGLLFGIQDPIWSMFALAIGFAIAFNAFKRFTHASNDTVLGVLFAFIVAAGIALLSHGGGFSKFSGYLIGDILSVTPAQFTLMAAVGILVVIYWFFFSNYLVLLNLNESLVRSRGKSVFLLETGFAILVAITVIMALRVVGILVINSLLILPAAAARNVARSNNQYTLLAILFSMASGILGLLCSYYIDTASGATIALFGAVIYAVTTFFRKL